jgi:hypothetical protein
MFKKCVQLFAEWILKMCLVIQAGSMSVSSYDINHQ